MNSPSPSAPLPVAAAVHLAGAMDTLRLADDALAVALDALREIEPENQGSVICCDLTGMHAAVKIWLASFAGVADLLRLPQGASAFHRHIVERIEDPRNPPGLERAALALGFAVANLGEAIDATDHDDEWHSRLIAASCTLELMQAAIEGAIVRRWPRPGFGCN